MLLNYEFWFKKIIITIFYKAALLYARHGKGIDI